MSTNIYYIGSLCKRNHKYMERNESLRYKKNSGCVQCEKEYSLKYREKRILYNKEWRQILRLEVFTHYSNGTPKCNCCGESYIEFLTINHIKGGGHKQRKILNIRSGWVFYQWLRKNNYPKNYRVLCYNCNCAIGFFGYCPHEEKKK